MRQPTYVKKNQLAWWEVAEPELRSATDAVVRPIAAARCDGDKVFLQLIRSGKLRPEKITTVLAS